MEEAMGSGKELQQLQRGQDAIIALLRAENSSLEDKVRSLDGSVEFLEGKVESLQGVVARLRSSLQEYSAENELLKRRLFGTKSERTNTSEFQLFIKGLFPEEDAMREALEQQLAPGHNPQSGDDGRESELEKKPRPKPKGRRNLDLSNLERIVHDIDDPELAKRGRMIGREESFELFRIPGSFKVLVKRTAVYEIEQGGHKTVLAATQPPRLFPRSMAHESTFAWLACEKFGLGVPHYRLEQLLKAGDVPLDRTTMGRYMEELGGTLGATIVEAMFEDARSNCHVLSTDATGAAIQPVPSADKRRQACKHGHFFTVVADREHVLYHYAEKHTSKAVAELFKGFSGLLQSDASSVYDILDRGAPESTEGKLQMVGCWAHCRRYFFEAAITKHPGALDGLCRIREMFRVEARYADLSPAERTRHRAKMLGPLIDEFFRWVEAVRPCQQERSKLSQALGYAHNQEQELRRVLLDGRLALDNNRSERALRRIVVGRKNWLFYGSDIHAERAASIFTILASCRLHRLDPMSYLCEVLRVLPYWPRQRYIELAPSRWARTRARLDAEQLARPMGEIEVPPPEVGQPTDVEREPPDG